MVKLCVTLINTAGTRFEVDGVVYTIDEDTVLKEDGKTIAVGIADIKVLLKEGDKVSVEKNVITRIFSIAAVEAYTIADVTDTVEFFTELAEVDGSILETEDGLIVFVGSPKTDDYGRSSGLKLTKVEPTLTRTAEKYVVVDIDGENYYVVFDATPVAGADGRTSKYLCAIADPATGYDEAFDLGVSGYKFDFFFGQEKEAK